MANKDINLADYVAAKERLSLIKMIIYKTEHYLNELRVLQEATEEEIAEMEHNQKGWKNDRT